MLKRSPLMDYIKTATRDALTPGLKTRPTMEQWTRASTASDE
jgi:hypothetical protein